MDDAMTPLPDDVLLSRVVPQAAFGGLDVNEIAGMKVRDAGFTSTQYGTAPATTDVRLHIAAPAGTRAVVNADTGEVVLDRDTEMVVAKVETNSAGGHDMYLTVLPKTGTKSAPKAELGATAGGEQVRADLMKFKVPELQAQMRERGLKPGKKRKSELVDALVADETGSDTEADTPTAPHLSRIAAAATGQDALDVPPLSLVRQDTYARIGNRNGLPLASREALIAYREHEYSRINGQLRDAGQGLDPLDDPAADQWIKNIDAAMGTSRLPEDVLLWRGLRTGNRIFGDRLQGDLTGMVWREHAYVSASADPAIADQFAGSKGVRMRVLAPAGVGAVQVTGMNDDQDRPGEEAEVLLEHGVGMRVIADRGVDPDGVRHLDVEVLPVEAGADGV
ncbi:ADP-ribosyltransferase [Micromonosporaceae bacterium Da 78-11]